MGDQLTWALHYLEKGLHPIPLQPRSKKPPRGFGYKKYQNTAPKIEDLQKWFARTDNNVAVLLGRGLIAVDLDGEGAEEVLEEAGIELPAKAPRSKTSSGYHVLLRVKEDLGDRVNLFKKKKNAAGKLEKPLVDIRGIGYIVAPPSIHPSGHVYEWEYRLGDDIPAAPAALVELIKRTASTKSKKNGTNVGPEAPKWVAQALDGVGEGQRDDICAKLAGYFLGHSMPVDIVRSSLYLWADKCKPPFPRDQVDKTVESITKKDAAARDKADEDARREFQILGYNQGSYFYLPRGSSQIVELRAESHTKLNFLRLAPLQYWEASYAGKHGVQWDMAANALIRQAEARGVYDVSRVRGRGAWWDNNRAVLHLGDRLVVGDTETPIVDVGLGYYVYQAAPPMPVEHSDPLPVDDANTLIDICELVNWERPISARLLAGWATVAPICGALAWRPHIWLTGPAGCGKSWVIDHIIRRMLGEIGIPVLGETTEAGVRQILGHDARPIVFDEAEGSDQRAQIRIQNILALARQASSETGAAIIKGTPGGIAKTYRIRSCFAFSSIGVGLQQHADSTRVTVLSIERRDDPEKFQKLKVLCADTFTETYVRRFIARSIRLVPVIRQNSETFASAGAAVIGSQRMGDQIGVLLAGAYSLFDEGLIEPQEAREWLEEQDWSEQKGVQDQNDEQLCLARILEHVVRIPPTHDRSIAELIKIAFVTSGNQDDKVTQTTAEEALWRLGIRIDQDHFTISNTHTAIAGILAQTTWAHGWARVLKRIPDAETTAHPARFGAVKGRGVMIPLDFLE